MIVATVAGALAGTAWIGNAWLGSAWPAGLPAVPAVSSETSVRMTALDPFDAPLLWDYGAFRDAAMAGEHAVLARLARRDDSYLAYRSALTLAHTTDLEPATRLEFYHRAAELRIADPLARQENREFYLTFGAVAEAAADLPAAVEAYAEALPDEIAVEALARLVDDPYRLSNHYFKARLYEEALASLDGRAAPSIEAPSHRRLGEYHEALDAYERWLVEQPGNIEALYGVAWTHFYLGNMSSAYALFGELDGASSLYARALIDYREGNLGEAVELMRQTGVPSRLWLASGWLEAEDRYRDALPIYLELAAGDSVYSDDSAYRAMVLAERLAEPEAHQRARELLPEGSFFALQMGGSPLLPDRDELPLVRPAALELAAELARVGDLQAAVGELIFALREEEDEARAVALAERLQAYGEFRQSQREIQRFITAGSRELRTWRAAYPRAYQEEVIRAATSQQLDPELVWAVMRQESAFYPGAVSVSNAGGLMQVIPSTWDWLAELQKEEPGDRFDPAANIRYGSFYLRWLMDYHDGDAELVIPSYNRGQGYIRRLFEGPVVNGDKNEFYREIDALETREYLQRVMVNYRIYQALYERGERTASNPEEGADEAGVQ